MPKRQGIPQENTHMAAKTTKKAKKRNERKKITSLLLARIMKQKDNGMAGNKKTKSFNYMYTEKQTNKPNNQQNKQINKHTSYRFRYVNFTYFLYLIYYFILF